MPKAESDQLYVYGRFYGRFDEDIIKEHISVELIEKAITLAKKGSSDEKDDFIDEVADSVNNFNIEALLSEIVISDKESLKVLEKSWKDNRSFGLWMEEMVFGIAPTAAGAKEEFLKVNDGDDGEDW